MIEKNTHREYRNIESLRNWDKNPRSIEKKDFQRLLEQIKKLGQYKPLIITDDGLVLGGNMRLRAYRELGITDIWVSVVVAPTQKERLEYALSDNDRAGQYDEEVLAELIRDTQGFDQDLYRIDLGKLSTIKEWLIFLKEKHNKSIVRYPMIKANGKVFIQTESGLQCPQCLHMQPVNRTVENSLKHPSGYVYGYYLTEESHSEDCEQK